MAQLLGFGLSGYRSFGETPQYLYPLSKINVICGANNCGKSNILRFAKSVLAAKVNNTDASDRLDPFLDRYSFKDLPVSLILPIPMNEGMPDLLPGLKAIERDAIRKGCRTIVGNPYLQDLLVDGCFWLKFDYIKRSNLDPYGPLVVAFNDRLNAGPSERHSRTDFMLALSEIHQAFPGLRQEDLTQLNMEMLVPRVFEELFLGLHTSRDFQMVGAIRNIGDTSSNFDDEYGGSGVIKWLHEIKDPPKDKRDDILKKFLPIQRFVRTVLDCECAELVIPHDGSELLVSLDGVDRPLKSLGQGVNQVILLAIAAMRTGDGVLCIEEPEQHLHPVLQRKLLDYLATMNGTYILSTHSSVFVDHPGASLFSVRLADSGSEISKPVTKTQKHILLHELGYRASDLLQCNCVVWVEGPSDAIYLRHWLRMTDPKLREGVDYKFLQYGGKNVAHLTLDEDETADDKLIHCLKICRRCFLMVDRDKPNGTDILNDTKLRLLSETAMAAKHKAVWVTDGREIENYLEVDTVEDYLKSKYKPWRNAVTVATATEWEFHDRLAFMAVPKSKVGVETYEVDKVDLALWATERHGPLGPPLLVTRVATLVTFIKEASHLNTSVIGGSNKCDKCGK